MSETIEINKKPVEVEQVRSDWALALMSRGVIVKLSMSRWRARTKLTPEMMGLKFVDEKTFDFHNKYLELGEHKLFPPNEIINVEILERRARMLLENYSFDTVWGKFVPFTAFDEWERENDLIRKDWFEQARMIGNRYDSILEVVRNEYRNMAKDVWVRLYAQDKGGPTESFITDFVQKVVEKIPPREEIVSSFKYNITYFVIPMPSLIEENLARAEQIKRQSEMECFNSQIEQQTKRRISEEYIKRKKELIDSFLETTVISMRSYVGELCNSVLQSIGCRSKTGNVTTQHVNKIKAMVKKVKLLNFYDDEEVASLLNDLDNEVDKIKGESSKDVIVEKLREIVEVGKRDFVPKNFNPSISVLEADSI
jgi:hypothetical protein